MRRLLGPHQWYVVTFFVLENEMTCQAIQKYDQAETDNVKTRNKVSVFIIDNLKPYHSRPHMERQIHIYSNHLYLSSNHLYLASNHLYLGTNDLKIGINDLYQGSNDLYLSSNTTICT